MGLPEREFYSHTYKEKRVLDEQPMFSLVVVMWNNLELNKKCIESIRQFSKFYELIIVDNESTDGTSEWLDELSENWKEKANLKIITATKNSGWPASLNVGINYAEGQTLVWMNNDLEVTPAWLEKMYAHLQYSEDVGIVGPTSNFVMGVQQADLNERFKPYGNHHEVKFLIGFCMMIKGSCLGKIGWVDETFWDIEAKSGSADDIDISIRAREAGFKLIIARDVFIHHYGSRSFVAIFGEELYTQGTEGNKKYMEDVQKYIKRLEEKWGIEKVKDTLTAPPLPPKCLGTIGTPHGDHFPCETVHSFLSAKIPANVKLVMNYGSAVTQARNNIVKQMEGDWIMFIDSDMTFPPDAITKMIQNIQDKNVDICTAVCYRKVPNFEPCIFKKATGNNPQYKFIGDWPRDRLFEIDACGSAFVIIKRSVLEAIKEPWYSYSDFLSEDLNLCRKAKDYGFRIWCDPSIPIGHVKGFPYGDMVYRMNEENKRHIKNAPQEWPEMWNYGIKKKPMKNASELMEMSDRSTNLHIIKEK